MWGHVMKTLTLEDDLYTAMEEEALRVGCTVDEMVSEVVSSWLANIQLDEGERTAVEAARPEAPFGRDRGKIRIHGDIIEPVGMEWEAEFNPD